MYNIGMKREYLYRKEYWSLVGKAHSAVSGAKRDGILAPVNTHNCVDCGRIAENYDHRDYRKPLDVEPVCRKCNHKRGNAMQVKKDKLDWQVFTRVSYRDMRKMKSLAKKSKMNMSEWIRDAIYKAIEDEKK